jgi:hypothetical protein
MSERRTPSWTAPLDEPFRSDPSFSRSVAASADAFVLTVIAAVAAVLMRLSGAGVGLVVLPFVLPVLLLALALAAARRFHREVVVASQVSSESWRDRERQAVATVFLPALVRNRISRG